VDKLDIARWQFAITTVYHFLFVPLTIGLSFLVAWLQTRWHRTGDPTYLRLTKLYGKLFLINFALGVVTGIVQEFQFGMNWSDYSRFVGDIFGAPLAIEGLLAFFLESTFLGLWIFGWGRLKPRLHLATIWLAAIGTMLSAYFILAANSFMQNPVGAEVNLATGRAELTDFWKVLTNPVVLVTFPHTIAAAFLTSGGLVLGVALWHLVRRGQDADAFRIAARLGSVVMIAAAAVVVLTGDWQARVMTDVQPMKMAAAEALYDSSDRASFSVFTIGTLGDHEELWSLRIPGLLSFLAEGDWNATVEGINDLQAEYEATYGAGSSYKPNIPITYWTFRLMIGVGLLGAVAAAWVLWRLKRHDARFPDARWVVAIAVLLPLTGVLGNTFGWIFTEMGRQPWVVFGLMPTAAGVSPGVSAAQVLLTMTGFTLLYGLLAVIEVRLLLSTIRAGLPDAEPELGASTRAEDDAAHDEPLVLVY